MNNNFPGRETYGKHWWWKAEDDEKKVHFYKWDYRFGQYPHIREAGITGWARFPASDKAIRLHLCAFETNCPSRHDGTKRGCYGTCVHVRFRGFMPEDWVPPVQSPTGHAVSPGGGSPTVATDLASAVAVVPSLDVDVAVSPAASGRGGVEEGDVAAGGISPPPVDLSAVAPAPPPPVAASPWTGPIPPSPPRAALDLLPPGLPSHSSELLPPPFRLASGIPAVAGDLANTDVDDPMDEMPTLKDPEIARELATFLEGLRRKGSYVGVSAFVLFSLAFGYRVKSFFDGEEHDIFQWGEHAYWDRELTDAHIPRTGDYSAIATSIVELPAGGLKDVALVQSDPNNGFKMNHWIAGVQIEKGIHFKHAPLTVRGEPGLSLSEVYMKKKCTSWKR